MPLKPLVTISALSMIVTIALPATAACDRFTNSLERTYCKEQGSITDVKPAADRPTRYRDLAQAVSQIVYDYYKRTGEVFPVSDETIEEVLRMVGASQSEARFVIEQLVATVQAIAALPPLQTL